MNLCLKIIFSSFLPSVFPSFLPLVFVAEASSQYLFLLTPGSFVLFSSSTKAKEKVAMSPLAWLNPQGVSPAVFWEGTVEKICLGQHPISGSQGKEVSSKGGSYRIPPSCLSQHKVHASLSSLSLKVSGDFIKALLRD